MAPTKFSAHIHSRGSGENDGRRKTGLIKFATIPIRNAAGWDHRQDLHLETKTMSPLLQGDREYAWFRLWSAEARK